MGWWPVTEGVMTQLLCVDSVKFFLHMAMTACKSLTFLRERKWETRNGVKLLFAIFPPPALSWSSTLYAIIVVNVYASFPFFLPAFWCPGYYPGVAGEIEEVSLEGARDRDQYERKGMTTCVDQSMSCYTIAQCIYVCWWVSVYASHSSGGSAMDSQSGSRYIERACKTTSIIGTTFVS